MLDILSPYLEYKDSELQFFGQIPKHWKVLRNSRIFKQQNQTGFPDLPILEVSLKTGVRVRNFETSKRKQIMSDYEKYKRVCKGEIAYNMMRMWQGAVGVAPVDGLVSPAYVVASPLSEEVDSRYYSYLFRTDTYMNEINKYSHGIVADRNRLYWDEFKQIPSLYPPREEQYQIAKYLDWQLARIDRFIKVKKKLILALKEQRQATINDAVTKGVIPNMKMKPSGIEDLDEVPENWEIRALKYYVKSNIETLSETYDSNCEINYIDISTVGFGELKRSPVKYKFKEAPSRARRVVHNGDTIISTVRTYLKSMCFIDESIESCIVSTGFAVLTPNELVYPRLLNYILSSSYFMNMVSKNSVGVSYPAISESKLISLKILLPNSIEEQKLILKFINEETENIDRTILASEKEIHLLVEYRTRLISDVVTGKLDVRDLEILEKIDDIDMENIEEFLSDSEEVLDNEECEV